MNYPFRNLVFEGGGVKGMAYAGALKVLEQKGILQGITRIGGTSAGAITAVMVGLNYSPDRIRETLYNLDFKKFEDDTFGYIRDCERLLHQYGWCKGDYFRDWIGKIIGSKTGNADATFADIQAQKAQKGFLDLYFIGTNISTHFSEVFSFEHTPRMCVADAVRISMSIPIFFTARKSARGDIYVDGGVLDNYPIKLFDRERYMEKSTIDTHGRIPDYYSRHNAELREQGLNISPYIYNKETLGFRLDTEREIAMFRDQAEPVALEIENFYDYCLNLVKTFMDAQSNSHLHSDDWQRTVYIDTLGVKTTDFSMTDCKKDGLVASGRSGTDAYFTWYDDPNSKPVNHI